MNHARQYTRHGDVKNRADQQGNDDADGKIALGILGFLSGGGDSVKSDICKKDVRGASPMPEKPIGANECQSWPQLEKST